MARTNDPPHAIPHGPRYNADAVRLSGGGLLGRLDFHHYDYCAQALAKIERGHTQDREDVSEILARGLVSVDELRRRFAEIEPLLHRFPAIDPPSFRRGVEGAAAAAGRRR